MRFFYTLYPTRYYSLPNLLLNPRYGASSCAAVRRLTYGATTPCAAARSSAQASISVNTASVSSR